MSMCFSLPIVYMCQDIYRKIFNVVGFPGGSDGKESACIAGDLGSIPGLGRFPGEGNGCPLQYSSLENSLDRGAWQATVHVVAESDTTEQLSLTHFFIYLRTPVSFFILYIEAFTHLERMFF